MRGYLAILKIRMKTLLQYRAAALAGICTQLFWGMVMAMTLRAFYNEAPSTHQPLSVEQAITFIWIGQALLQLMPWNIDKEIEAQIRNGNVVYELVRPIHLYGLWFARAFAMRLIPTAMRCLPIFFFGGLLFGFSPPVSWEAAAVFCCSIFLALFLSSTITTLVITTLFWTLSGEGILRLLPHITVLLSGMVVPLPLFPGWVQPFLNLQPFRGIVDIPCRLYTGVIPSAEAPMYLGFQVGWILLLTIAGLALMRRATHRFVIQGG